MTLAHAYEATEMDVLAVMREAGLDPSLDEAERAFAAHVAPRQAEVARAALAGDGLDDQTASANARIREILDEAGLIPGAPAP